MLPESIVLLPFLWLM